MVSCEKIYTDMLAILFLNNIIVFFYSKNSFFPLSTFHVTLVDSANVYFKKNKTKTQPFIELLLSVVTVINLIGKEKISEYHMMMPLGYF